MKKLFVSALLATFATLAHAEPVALFNGKDLTGWEGNMELWSVKDGVITGLSTAEKNSPENTYLIWKGGEVANFELTVKYRITPLDDKNNANSGIQYRSKILDAEKWIVGGYQADFESGKTYSGIFYEERGRGILGKRGQIIKLTQGAEPMKPVIEIIGTVGKDEEIQAAIKSTDWNEYRIVAEGNHFKHFINGVATVEATDETAEAAKSGILAFQLHAGAVMKLEFKDILYTAK